MSVQPEALGTKGSFSKCYPCSRSDLLPIFPVEQTVFYHLIQDADLDRPESIREVLTTVRASGGAVLRYHRWSNKKKVYLKYEPKAAASVGS